MMYGVILALHLGVTALTALVTGYSLYAVWRHKEGAYRQCALWLGYIAAFEVLTGTALALISQTLLAPALGLHIALYLGVCLATELLLFIRMKHFARMLPLEVAASPILAGVAYLAVALARF